MVSHFHLDHAGLIRDFQDAGIECLIFENQSNGIEEMERIIAPKYKGYRNIDPNAFTKIESLTSRKFLKSIGIGAEVIKTIGHSDDSVSLILDNHDVLIGDLYPISQIMPEDSKSNESWHRIRAAGGRHIFPSHSIPFELDEAK
jgi:glyoxylase-like metal-dependent hydrolase (beta-lactamase superfamily II)